MSRLDRFKQAQSSTHAGFQTALGEIRAGRKRSHWIWYVFPQLAGLGTSSMSRAYAIDGIEEATEFLGDAELRSRYLSIARAVEEQLRSERRPAVREVMGSEIDAQKLVSSLTLFGEVARAIQATDPSEEYDAIVKTADEVLAIAGTQGYQPCARTIEQLRAKRPSP
jgi:uncharacterized protein (DUF1810 family)